MLFPASSATHKDDRLKNITQSLLKPLQFITQRLIKVFNYLIFNLTILTNNKEDNFYFFAKRIEQEFPKGLMFVYEGINFYIRDFCQNEYGGESLNYNEDKVFVVCEYYDIESKVWSEKIMHEDFVRNRFNQFKKIMEQ